MREIVLDTETTGLDPVAGHRVVEVACLELVNHLPTGRTFQRYLNPERDMPPEAERIHGLSADFLRKHPLFAAVATEFLDFLGEAALVIHNAAFDVGFLNAELKRTGLPLLKGREVVDTVSIARRRFPGAQANLDALCRRFGIDNSARKFHGALLDCELLAEVYLELIGGRQPGLALNPAKQKAALQGKREAVSHSPRPHAPTAEEAAAHDMMLDRLPEPLWRR